MKRTLLATTILSTLLSTSVLAGGGHFYAGASAGKIDQDNGVSNLTGTAALDEDESGYKLFGGYQYNDNIAVEVHYTDIGDATLSGNSGDTFDIDGSTFAFTANNVTLTGEGESYGVSAIFIYPLSENVKPFARVGIQRWEVEYSASTDAGNAQLSDDGTDPFYGIGVDVSLNDSIAVRAEYERYEFGSDDADFLSIGLRVSF